MADAITVGVTLLPKERDLDLQFIEMCQMSVLLTYTHLFNGMHQVSVLFSVYSPVYCKVPGIADRYLPRVTVTVSVTQKPLDLHLIEACYG